MSDESDTASPFVRDTSQYVDTRRNVRKSVASRSDASSTPSPGRGSERGLPSPHFSAGRGRRPRLAKRARGSARGLPSPYFSAGRGRRPRLAKRAAGRAGGGVTPSNIPSNAELLPDSP